jgi:hypothetical protein
MTMEREGIERRADVVRSKLICTLEALDRKRREARDVGRNVRRHPLLTALVVAFVLGGAATAVALRVVRRPRRTRSLRSWRPFRTSSAAALAPSTPRLLTRSLLVTIVAELAKQAIRALVAPRKRDSAAFDVRQPSSLRGRG